MENEVEKLRSRIIELEASEAKHKKSEETLRHALREAYDELEKKVEKRTKDLIDANEKFQQEIAERNRVEDALRYRIEFEKLITTLSTKFIKLLPDETPSAINNALQMIGRFVGVDSINIILFSDDGSRIKDIYAWCKEGIKQRFQNLKGCSVDEQFPWFAKKIKRRGIFHISSCNELPPEANAEKEYFLTYGIQSIIAVPMFCGSSFIGFICFNSIQVNKIWEVDITALLKIVGEIFANTLERNCMEVALRKSENKYRLLFECASDGIALLDVNGNILHCNNAFMKLLGFYREEIQGKHITTFYNDKSKGMFRERFENIKKNEQDESEVEIVCKDGKTLPIWNKVRAIYDDHGNFIGALKHYRDITQKKQNEQMLRRSHQEMEKQVAEQTYNLNAVKSQLYKEIVERRRAEDAKQLAYAELEQIFNTAADGMSVIDESFNIIQINNTLLKILGIKKDETLRKKCYEVFQSPFCHTSHCPLGRILNGEDRFEDVIEIKRKDGHKRISCILTAIPFRGPNGELIGIIEDFKDVTNHNQIQGILKKPILINQESLERTNKIAQENENTERMLLDACSDSAFLVDTQGTILTLNEKAAQDLDKCSEELKGLSFYDFFPPKLSTARKKQIFETVRLAKPICFEEEFEGTQINYHYCPILDGQGKVEKIAIFSRDIKGYRKKDNGLKEHEEIVRDQDRNRYIYLLKNKDTKKLPSKRILQDLSLGKHIREEAVYNHRFKNIISCSERIWNLFDIIPSVAESVSTVLLQGESGTGKHLFANAIHNSSPRRKKPFIILNCGALPDTLLESELFGYKAGAFTDAKKDKLGRFALADGGTLFLDEIGDISPAMQIRLLHFLQERVYEPLGSEKSIRADVRIIAATNKDLKALVKKGKFRQDLYYRINVVKLDLPPLRERIKDVPLLVKHFIARLNEQQGKKVKGITDDALMSLLSYDYPGNVRELENIIEHAFVLCRSGKIERRHLPEGLYNSSDREFSNEKGLTPFMQVEADFLMNALRQNNWNRLETARQLGIHKATLFRKIKSLGLKLPPSGKQSGS